LACVFDVLLFFFQAAFVPAAPAGVRTVAMAGAKSMALPFLPQPKMLDGSYPGDVGFDPLGLSERAPEDLPQVVPRAATMASEVPLPTVYWMREAELKHGRLCMLAICGFVAVDTGAHWPGTAAPLLSSAVAHDWGVANGQMGFLLVLASVFELMTMPALNQAAKGSDREAGDFALDPLKWTAKPADKERLKLSEVIHSRLAMVAFSGMVTQAVAVSDKFPYTGL